MQKLTTTLLLIVKDGKILLAQKKRGFGAGLFNGVGGKVEAGETIEQAMLRETREEINVVPINYTKMAEIDFDEIIKGKRTFVNMHIFLAANYTGTPQETEEMAPQWFVIDAIPYSKMFKDDSYWLPQILAGKKCRGNFVYDKDFNMISHKIKIVNNA